MTGADDRAVSRGAVYLYAVADAALTGTDLPEVTGLDAAPVRTLVENGLAALVSTVAADRYGEEALQHSLEDLAWLERTARTHHAVVDAAADRSPVVPVRMATVYLGDDRVRAMLAERAPELTAALDRVRGRHEYGVKALAVAAPPAVPASADGDPGSSAPGTEYLRRRQAERNHAAVTRADAAEAAGRLHERLTAAAVATRSYPPQDRRLTGERDEMVLNAAYLVDDDGAAALRDAVTAWDDPCLRVVVTGPWAPYSFASLEEEQ